MDLIAEKLKRYWGYEKLRPLQREATQAVLDGRDSLVVLPTGGGKSLCFQAPAVAMEGVALVVSPLVSLMKDQVDALGECGVAAARLDSSLTYAERMDALDLARQDRLKLLYLSPERLLSEGFLDVIRGLRVSFVAVDEAHCISMWGHDFRPEYRGLGALREALPGVALHAYTATATEQVRQDIIDGLHLRSPEVLIGSFDRPNLVYHVRRRERLFDQILEVVEQHRGESGIVYCNRRKDVDSICAQLREAGWNAAPYHAGMDPEHRRARQEAFTREQVDIIVATVAFGMGIDKSNVRFVIHSGMPKTVEHYQQESGRAGRDGLEAECVLFYSGQDLSFWKYMHNEIEGDARRIALSKLNDMYDYCTLAACRHQMLLGFFGQRLEKDNCGACDVCQGELEALPAGEALVTAQKILSCVVRLGERFGGDYTASVLIGDGDARIAERGHNQLSTHGLLSDLPKPLVRDYIEQLTAQGWMARDPEHQTLAVTPAGWRVLRGQVTPRLYQTDAHETAAGSRRRRRDGRGADAPMDTATKSLFERLRELRKQIAEARGVPAYVVFGDAALRDMARRRPQNKAQFRKVSGVGERKCEQYAPLFLPVIRQETLEDAAG